MSLFLFMKKLIEKIKKIRKEKKTILCTIDYTFYDEDYIYIYDMEGGFDNV